MRSRLQLHHAIIAMACFAFNSSAASRLLEWKQGKVDDRWTEKAVVSLVKKLTKRDLSILEMALSSASADTMCVLLDRSYDGSIQIQHRKGLPHTIYCRIWRWPDLESYHELRALPHCEYTFSRYKDKICINPYHYARVTAQEVIPVVVPSHVTYTRAPDPSFYHQPDNDAAACADYSLPRAYTHTVRYYPEPAEPTVTTYDPVTTVPSPPSSGSGLSPLSSTSSNPSPQISSTGFSSSGSSCSASGNLSPLLSSMNKIAISPVSVAGTQICYQEQRQWCSISYYELNDRIGEIFYASSSTVSIDGYTDPNSTDRFCVGHLSNINRNPTIVKTRQHIGSGVELVYTCGEVFIRCLSTSPVFIHSRISNQINGYMPTAVCKLFPGAELKVFDDQLFAAILSQTIHDCHSFSTVYDLMRLCSIKLSYAKGWGEKYHRQRVSDTPCWLEIQFHGALTWIDKVLHQMKLQSCCGSDS